MVVVALAALLPAPVESTEAPQREGRIAGKGGQPPARAEGALRYLGRVANQRGARVRAVAATRGGKIARVRRITLADVRIGCRDGFRGVSTFSFHALGTDRRGRFAKREPIQFPDAVAGSERVKGRLGTGGGRMRGAFRIVYRLRDGTVCGTGTARFRAVRR